MYLEIYYSFFNCVFLNVYVIRSTHNLQCRFNEIQLSMIGILNSSYSHRRKLALMISIKQVEMRNTDMFSFH